MNRYRFIGAEQEAGQAVQTVCRVLKVSRSAYYQWRKHPLPSVREAASQALGERIMAIHKASGGAYGAPRVQEQLRQEGRHCGRKRVARLMGERGLAGRQRRRSRRTTVADAKALTKAEDLVQRRFAPARYTPDQIWVGDISYVRTWEGWLYLATVIDLSSRRVVGLALADHMRTSLVIEAMDMALTSRRPPQGLIFHSDRGSQYTSKTFRNLLLRHGIQQSLSRPGQCWDNAVAESFFATLKLELVYRSGWPTRGAARRAIFAYIEGFYNRRRLHSSLGYRSPVNYEARSADVCKTINAA